MYALIVCEEHAPSFTDNMLFPIHITGEVSGAAKSVQAEEDSENMMERESPFETFETLATNDLSRQRTCSRSR